MHFEASLDKGEYDIHDLVTLRVPLSMPYLSDWKGFRRVDGEINFNGQHYRYVMRKVEKGQLVLLCLPDHNRSMLENGRNEYAAHSNDIAPSSPSKKNAGSFKKSNLPGEYEVAFPASVKKPIFRGKEEETVFLLSCLTYCFISSPGEPPEPSCC